MRVLSSILIWAVFVAAQPRTTSVVHVDRSLELYPISVSYADIPMMEYEPADQREQWLKDAGVPYEEWPAAKELISRESGWRPDAVNSSSGACSLVQALPCSKIPGDWSDPVNAIRWGNQYVINRYGGWPGALAHSHLKNWY